ncbi:protein transport protein SEC24 [Pseudohyphozyma bogoriensis]|nr:protein transport protein SEC24 [Pseudohyphozyma bogoriensis]
MPPQQHQQQPPYPQQQVLHPQQQPYPPNVDPRAALAQQMSHVGLNSPQHQQQPQQHAPPAQQLQQQPLEPVVKGKRSARAYHAPTDPSMAATGQGAPPPSQQHQGPPYQQGQPQGHHPQQQQMQHQPHQQPQFHAEAAASQFPPSGHPDHPPASYADPAPQPQIPQPPHSAGSRIPPKFRVKIDPDHIPSPVAVAETDQELYATEPFLTCSRTAAPLSGTDFVAIDQGNSNPRFIRATTYSLPTTDDLATASQLPLGLIIQPFAALRPEEGVVPIVDFTVPTEPAFEQDPNALVPPGPGDGTPDGASTPKPVQDEQGPPRCNRCRGYINPWCSFVEGGTKWVCNLCGASSEVASSYFSHLDMSQRRIDLDQRPELRLGSVDFVVGPSYYVQDHHPPSTSTSFGSSTARLPPTSRVPEPMKYVFAIDISWSAGRCGLVKEAARGIKELLYPEDGSPSGLPVGAKVAIMTFDKAVMFYNLKPTLEQAQMMVVPDIMDMFLPMQEGFLVDPVESKPVIESLLDSLPTLSADNQNVEAAIGGPLKAAIIALKNAGGQINIFQTSLPTIGPGALKHREDTKLYGTDREKTLFASQDTFYRTTAEECVEAGVGVNVFLFPTQYIDVASIGVLPGLTGGELFFHPRFEPVRDGGKLRAEIKRVASRETGYSVTMRIRCSNGLRVADHFGNFFQRNVTDLEFGTLDSDKAIAARIKHEGKLDEKVDAHFQCAVLYTSASGQRRVRVHNLAVPTTTLLANVFRFADMDTTLAYIAKDCITQTNAKTLRVVRENLTELCVKALLAYRKHCASSTSPAQLILPESFKLFPLYALALSKSKALKGGSVASDVRVWQMRLIKSAGVAATVGLLYPRMIPLHNLPDEVGFPEPSGKLKLPTFIRASYVRMEPNGAYLIENGEIAIIWFGSSVSPQIIQDLYAVETLQELDVRMGTLPSLPTRLSTQVRNVLTYLEAQRGGRSLPVLIARQNIDGTEIEFSNMLVEDQNNEGLSYPDYLCAVHAKIQHYLTDQSKNDSSATSDYSSYSSFMH